MCLATKSRYTQNRSVAASISNSKIHRYEHTENNSVHAHQLSDDRSRISKARAAYPSTSDRDTRVLPAGIPHGGPHYIPVVYVVQHPRGPPGAVIPRHRPNRRHKWRLWASKEIYRRSLWTRRDSAPPRQNGATLFNALFRLLIDTPYRTSISPSWVLNRFYDISKDGLGHIGNIAKADGDILDPYV